MNLFTLMNLAIYQENKICRGWVHKGLYGYIADEIENISLRIIWAFFEHLFYRIVINPQVNTQHTFQYK